MKREHEGLGNKLLKTGPVEGGIRPLYLYHYTPPHSAMLTCYGWERVMPTPREERALFSAMARKMDGIDG
jgi:hypothetical protein